MKVDGVSLQGEQVFKAKMPVPAQLELEEIPQDSPPTAQIDEPSPTEPQSDIQNTDDTEDGKGVLRLLQEGHFKGVSDVRLRINFFEKLNAIEAAKLPFPVLPLPACGHSLPSYHSPFNHSSYYSCTTDSPHLIKLA